MLDGDLPRDPEYLSYSLAATCLLTLAERQELLEASTSLERLVMLRLALREEMRAMRAIPSLPATEVGAHQLVPELGGADELRLLRLPGRGSGRPRRGRAGLRVVRRPRAR